MSPKEAWTDFGQKVTADSGICDNISWIRYRFIYRFVQVDLTARLREILINYPEGTSILKAGPSKAISALLFYINPCPCIPLWTTQEMVQNGDDARATTISFCLDQRSHPTASLLGPLLADFQGPALLVHNNSVFTEQDFESISQIGDSVKRSQAGWEVKFNF